MSKLYTFGARLLHMQVLAAIAGTLAMFSGDYELGILCYIWSNLEKDT